VSIFDTGARAAARAIRAVNRVAATYHGSPLPRGAVFEEDAQLTEVAAGEFLGVTRPVLTVHRDDFAVAPKNGHVVEVAGVQYEVIRVVDDGYVDVRLVLSRL
jgi:hypothetical protein